MIKISDFKTFERGSFKGSFTVTLPSGLVIHECKLFEKDGRRWIGLPAKPFRTDDATGFKSLVGFVNRSTAEQFREAVLDAIDEMRKTRAADGSERTAV